MIVHLYGRKALRDNVTPFKWNSTMEIETEAKSFLCKTIVSKMNSIVVINGSGWQGWKRIETSKKNWPPFSSLHAIRNPRNFLVHISMIKIPLIFSYRLLRNFTAFETSNKFSFSNRNDLKTCPLIFHL